MMDRELEIKIDDLWTVVDPASLKWSDATKKPLTIQAVIVPFQFRVKTREGVMTGKAGDILIRGVQGEYYPCDLEIFYQSYDQGAE